MKNPVLCTAVTLLVLACGGGPADTPDITGVWEGSVSGEGFQLDLIVSFASTDEGISGELDIPQQGAVDMPLADILLSGDSVYFSLPSNLGRADFAGKVKGDTLMGDFMQSGTGGGFILVRTSSGAAEQEAGGEEVTISGEDVELAGTLTLPEGEGPHPCIMLLSGSGLQGRDEYVMGFPVFAELADLIGSCGYAVLRCDDRGFGGSAGGMDSFSDSVLLYDAGLMLDFLGADPGIDADSIGVMGHSEGSNIAFMLAAGRPGEVAFVISMAGPSISGYELIPGQLGPLLSMQGFSEEEILAKVEAQYMVQDAVIERDTATIDSVLRELARQELRKLPEEQLTAIGDIEAHLDRVVPPQLETTLSPWFRNFITSDPAEFISRVDVPVLCLLGELDLQVIPEHNLPPMQEALAGNPDHSIVVIEGANHLFQEAVTGAVTEYSQLEPRFIPAFRDTLCGWLGGR